MWWYDLEKVKIELGPGWKKDVNNSSFLEDIFCITFIQCAVLQENSFSSKLTMSKANGLRSLKQWTDINNSSWNCISLACGERGRKLARQWKCFLGGGASKEGFCSLIGLCFISLACPNHINLVYHLFYGNHYPFTIFSNPTPLFFNWSSVSFSL